MGKRRRRVRRDPERFYAPFGAIVAPAFVFAVLVIVTSYSPQQVSVYDLDLGRVEDSVAPLEEERPEPEPTEEMPAEMSPVDVMVDLPTVESVAATPSAADLQRLEPFRPEAVSLIRSPIELKSVAGQARSLEGRRDAIRRFGGNTKAEAAVLRALRWLKLRQLEDGSWDAKGEGDATAFALLLYLSHGEGATSREFGATVMRAIAYLVERHTNNMSVYALAEAAGVVRSPVLDEVVAEAVETMCQRQKDSVKANSGGLLQRYCAVMALKSAELAKVPVPSLERTQAMFEKAFVEMRDGKVGRWNRINGKGTWHYMVAGVCLQYLGRGEEANTRSLLGRLDELWPQATLGTTAIACCPVRSNYFSTMIFFNAGGQLWDRWNAGMLTAYVDAQTILDEGYVDPTGVTRQTGFWRCQDEHIGDQPFWPTCYVAHQLMVYYRYLPTYSKEAWGSAAPGPPPSRRKQPTVDVEVEI